MTDRTHRNTSIIIMIAALILIWGLALMTADKAQAASVGVINIDIGVNVRSGPGTDYDIIGGISYGSSVTITGQSGNWYIINYNGRTGYISADYVTISSEEEFTQTTATVNSSIGLNVRSGPGTTYSVLYTLDNGTVVTVTDKEGDWYIHNNSLSQSESFMNTVAYIVKKRKNCPCAALYAQGQYLPSN